MTSWAFKVIKGTDDSNAHEEKKYSAVDVLSMFLKNLKEVAEDYLGRNVDDAVITVPVDFLYSQCHEVKEAVQVAGFNVLEVISEPVAAATALGLRMTTKTNALIFDFGRTKLHVSLVIIDKNGKLELKAFNSNNYLGGHNIDNKLIDNIVKKIREFDVIFQNPYPLHRLRNICKKAKKGLSSHDLVYIEFDSMAEKELLTRLMLEELIEPIISKCKKTIEKCLRDARINKEDVDEVVLVGGSTRIPKVREMLQQYFNKKKLCTMIDPSEIDFIWCSTCCKRIKWKKNELADVDNYKNMLNRLENLCVPIISQLL